MAEEDYDGDMHNKSIEALCISQLRTHPADPKCVIDINTEGSETMTRLNPSSKRSDLCEDAQVSSRRIHYSDGRSAPATTGAEVNGSVDKMKQTPPRRSWTDELVLTDHVEYLKSRDWASTTLGPIDEWPMSLRLATHQMLADPRIACVYWFANMFILSAIDG